MVAKFTKQEVEEKLLEANVIMLEEYKFDTKAQHKMQCIKCNTEYISRPREIFQAFKNYGTNCCKRCAIEINSISRKLNSNDEDLLLLHGIKLLEPFKGTAEKHKMICTKCSFQFESTPDLRKRQIDINHDPCPNCNEISKKQAIQNSSVVLMLKQKGLELKSTYVNRNTSIKLKCITCSNEFEGIPSVILRNKQPGCSKCNSKLALPKHIFNNSSQAIIDKLLFHNIKLLEPLKAVKQHHKMQCLKCEHVWEATVLSKTQLPKNPELGCPKCSERRAEDSYNICRQRNIEILKSRGIEIVEENYDGRRSDEKIKVKNTTCGHIFECTPSNLLGGAEVVCGVCGPTKRGEVLTAWSKERSRQWRENAPEWLAYKSIVTSHTESNYKKHKNKINPNNYKRGIAGENGAYQLDHIVSVRFCFDNNIPAEICGHQDNLQMIPWINNTYASDCPKMTYPDIFFPYLPETLKNNTYVDILKNFFPHNSNISISGITPTLYFEDKKCAVFILPITNEFGNKKIAQKYKDIMSLEGISSLIFFEDEFIKKQQLVIDKINYKLQLTPNTPLIHARKCTLKPIDDTKIKNQFLDDHHIQGRDTCNIAYGAYSDNILIAVMTFSKPRIALGGRTIDEEEKVTTKWELSRFAVKSGLRVPGIASRLIEYFKNNNYWSEIYSYADKRISKGDMYYKLGFTLTANNQPDYSYVIDGKRKHRWNYRKDMLKTFLPNFNPALTEYDNMVNAGYWRIWDCGTLKFTLRNT